MINTNIDKKNVLIYNKKDSFHYKLTPKTNETIIPSYSDTMFTAMFNNTNRIKHPSNLISILFGFDKEQVYQNIELIKNKINIDNINDSKKTVDFVCKLDKKFINIEMNNFSSSKGSIERNLSYAFDLYKSSMKSGRRRYKYTYVYQVNFCNFSYKGNNNFIEEYYIQTKEGKMLTDKIIFIFIYLPKLKNICYNKDAKSLNELERYLSLLVETNIEKAWRIAKGNKEMEDYLKEAIETSSDEEIIGLYDKELHEERLKNTLIEETREEGFNAGLEEGLEQGLQQGSLGKSEEIAKKMLLKNMTKEEISEITGLSQKEIDNL